MTVKGQ